MLSPQISVRCSTRRYTINSQKIAAITKLVLECLKLDEFSIEIQFVSERAIRKLNREFRGKDYATDVLSFPQIEWKKPLLTKQKKLPQTFLPFEKSLGDLVISLSNAEKNAEAIGQDLDRETAFLIVHGILHLSGHDHMNPQEEARMLREQRHIMSFLESSPAKLAPKYRKCVAVT